MKNLFTRHPAALCFWITIISGVAHGQSLQYWNSSGTGGDGVWSTGPGDKNWNLIPGALAGNTAWQDGIDDVAVFQDPTGGVVTVFDTLRTAGIILNGANYTINAGSIVLAPDSALNAPFVNVQGGILTMNSPLTGNAGMIKTGSGTLLLTSANPYTGQTSIQGGTLRLAGSLASTNLAISSGATLLNQNNGLSDSTTLSNAGFLTLHAADTVTSYTSNGGTLTAGAGTLSTTNAALNAGSTLAGQLDTGSLTSSGAVGVSGTIFSNHIDIASGSLTNTGTLGNEFTSLNITGGARLLASGIQRYSLLTTSGTAAGIWQGNLHNPSTLAPGGMGGTGVLAILGNFTQAPGAALKLDLSAVGSDRLNITGSATFNGALVLNQLGATAIAPFVPVTVVSASSYSGNITSLSENLDGTVWFNPGNGTVTRLDTPSKSNSFFGSTRNQTSTWIALYDDVIDPGTANITSGPNGYEITNGLADTGNPDLLWALAASFVPGGLNAALLNRLSPEVYGGLSDYAIQSTRAHQRSALSAPALVPRDHTDSKGGMLNSTKSGAKGGQAAAATTLDWEFFAAADYFRTGTDNSRNQANYDFDGMGLLAGARTRPSDRTQLAVYFGVDSGTIHGELIDADASGWNSGITGEYLLDEKSRTRLTAGMSYGSYVFDGTRGSAAANAAGWAPGKVEFDDVDVDAFELFVGLDGVAWKQENRTFIPSAGLRYARSTMNSFDESTGSAPGSPIALDVNRDLHESLLLELGLLARVEVNPKLVLSGEFGMTIGLLRDARVLSANYAKGSRTMNAAADGLDDNSFYLGCGASYEITSDIRTGISYRADLRSGAEPQQELRLSSSWRF